MVYGHFEAFQEAYHRTYSQNYGFFRHIITHTVERYLACGDPREGVARYECGKCGQSTAIPFSCKTRLFCPSCHEKKTLLWIESIRTELLLPVSHRFWTFSIPKRLRPYFMYNRKLLSIIVDAANFALTAPLTEGRLVKNLRLGIISLIQTHSDFLEFNCHLHLIVTNGLVDYSDISCPKFQSVGRWDGPVITELFRWRLLTSLVKKKIISPEIADNMLSWPHSGFHVHATAPFDSSDAKLLENRLAYAFRPPVALNRLSFDGEMVTVTTTKRKQLTLTPPDFLAKLTLHIPNRYQNIRRYAGFYSPNIQSRVRQAREESKEIMQSVKEDAKQIMPKWAAMLAKIFGELPIACRKCGTIMDLKEFIFDDTIILKWFPYIARAPPKRTFEDYIPLGDDNIIYSRDVDIGFDAEFNQTRPEIDEDFNQDLSW